MSELERINNERDELQRKINSLIFDFQNKNRVQVRKLKKYFVGHQKAFKLIIEIPNLPPTK